MHRLTTLALFLCFASVLVAQEQEVSGLTDSLVRKFGVSEMRIELRSISPVNDSTYWIGTMYYDERGNLKESVSPLYRNKFERRIYAYDSLDRRVLYREYDAEDTSIFHSETKWIYRDSLHYRKELFYEGQMQSYTEYQLRYAPDTLWMTEDEYNLEYDTHEHKLSRYRYLGDSLQISEFISYDDCLKMRKVDTYFDLERDLDTGYLRMAGIYRVKEQEWDRFYESRERMRDLYENPDKYIQMQLDGAFAMEYEDDPYKYEIYNLQGQLVQSGRGILKKTYQYNGEGQLIKTTSWGEDWQNNYGPLVETHVTYYEYDDKGFPVKISSESIENQIKRILLYTYSF